MKNKETKTIFSSLENFSSIPPPELWDKIEAELDKPKKNRRAIIWWSVAASLVVGLSVPAILYFNSNQGNDIQLNIENNTNEVVLQKNLEDGANVHKERSFNNKNKSNIISNNSVNQSGNDNSNDKESDKNNIKLNKNQIHLNPSNQVVSASVSGIFSKSKEDSKSRILNQNVKEDYKANTIVANQKSLAVISKWELLNGNTTQISNSNDYVKTVIGKQNNTVLAFKTNKTIAENSNSKSQLVPDSPVQGSALYVYDKGVIPAKNTSILKSNTNKTIVETTNSKDSLGIIKSEVAKLEKALVDLDKDKTKKKTVSESVDKWSLQVFAGVMSSQNYNNEKALGNTVASKQSSGYGVKTNYKLNKKWAVSSGFKINELGQKIDGVSYYQQQSYAGALSSDLPIVSGLKQNSVANHYELVSISNNQSYLFTSNSDADNGLEKGNVTQNLKYFEMPLEVSYALLNKKKTSIIMNTGGFVGKLISNDIALNGNSIGENNNVNEYVYGTLLSSTLQYEFYKKTKFFIEPGMNYYINPLENQNFNQFQLVFNVGVNVSF